MYTLTRHIFWWNWWSLKSATRNEASVGEQHSGAAQQVAHGSGHAMIEGIVHDYRLLGKHNTWHVGCEAWCFIGFGNPWTSNVLHELHIPQGAQALFFISVDCQSFNTCMRRSKFCTYISMVVKTNKWSGVPLLSWRVSKIVLSARFEPWTCTLVQETGNSSHVLLDGTPGAAPRGLFEPDVSLQTEVNDTVCTWLHN